MTKSTEALAGRRILLVIAGGIAAYKSLELIRRLKERGARVRCVVTAAGSEFVTPLSVAALSGEPVHEDLFSLTGEIEMGHIRLSREADLVVVAPATADLLAKMAAGLADDLASTILLATDAPVLVAPAMNAHMWAHPAMQRNASTLSSDGIVFAGPADGDLACGETGPGRMVELADLLAAIEEHFAAAFDDSLAGLRALVTSGPTYEAIDPVRYLGNVSSGKQGHAVAAALGRRGAKVVLVSGPTNEPDPTGVIVHHVESARDMLAACEAALPVDVAVCAAAVADWRVEAAAAGKLKKSGAAPRLALVENPDILASLSRPGPRRPRLVVGFAAETEPDSARLAQTAAAKRAAKDCDWIVANDVSAGTQTFGGEHNTVQFVTPSGSESWPPQPKADVAARLAGRIAAHLESEAPAA